MKISITKHSKQRRSHLKIELDSFLESWMVYFEKQLYLKDKRDGIYKITSNKSCAVIRKNKDELILITFMGFKDFENKKEFQLVLNHQKDKVYRKDDLGKLRVCGDIKWDKEDSVVILKQKILEMYDIPTSNRISFKKNIDLEKYFYLENGNWILKDYPQKKEINSIFRKNYNGRIVRCGELVGDKIYLDYDMKDKYVIPIHEDNSSHIHKENDLWMLNDFERKSL